MSVSRSHPSLALSLVLKRRVEWEVMPGCGSALCPRISRWRPELVGEHFDAGLLSILPSLPARPRRPAEGAYLIMRERCHIWDALPD